MYSEIVTKAVVGKGRIANDGEVLIDVEHNISKVLGCWVINHFFVSNFDNGKVFAKGRYDIHVWYGVDNDTDTVVHKQTVDYFEEFSLNVKNDVEIKEDNEFSVRCVKYPTCVGVSLNESGKISVKIEKELGLDVIGETKLKVQISSNEEWLDDISNINVNYMNK